MMHCYFLYLVRLLVLIFAFLPTIGPIQAELNDPLLETPPPEVPRSHRARPRPDLLKKEQSQSQLVNALLDYDFSRRMNADDRSFVSILANGFVAKSCNIGLPGINGIGRWFIKCKKMASACLLLNLPWFNILESLD